MGVVAINIPISGMLTGDFYNYFKLNKKFDCKSYQIYSNPFKKYLQQGDLISVWPEPSKIYLFIKVLSTSVPNLPKTFCLTITSSLAVQIYHWKQELCQFCQCLFIKNNFCLILKVSHLLSCSVHWWWIEELFLWYGWPTKDF